MNRCYLAVAMSFLASPLSAQEFGFDIGAFEKKPFEWSGYVELRPELLDLNTDAALYPTQYPEGKTHETRINGALELRGDYRSGDNRLSTTWHGTGMDDSRESRSEGRLYEAYFNRKENANLSWEAGKRALKWGKGYAWNPVGFIERAKDPADPELGREGFVVASADWVRSGSGELRTVSFTPVLLPVREELNDDYGSEEANNLAAKLSLLYRDVDIDFMVLGNGSRPGRVGADFSLNLASHIEVHGEWAYVPDYAKRTISATGSTVTEEASHSYLLGLRYLTENDATWIVEYLHQDQGYSEAEVADFFSLLENSAQADRLAAAGQQAGYLRPTPMRDYLYLRVSGKDPFDWLYTSLAFTAIVNFNDHSAMLMPEFSWTSADDFELRLRYSALTGDTYSEFGEKLNAQRFELRLRYFF